MVEKDKPKFHISYRMTAAKTHEDKGE